MTEGWRSVLRQYRRRAHLSRAALAERLGVSPAALKSYELGTRTPPRPVLERLIAALGIPPSDANRIRLGAGHQATSPSLPDGFWPTVDELEREAAAYPWPVFVLNQAIELVVANRPCERVWNVDLAKEFTAPGSRHLIGVASLDRFGEQALNWDELVAVMIGFAKGNWSSGDLAQPPPLYDGALDAFLDGNPAFVKRLLRVWQDTPQRSWRSRTHYPVKWLHRGKTPMHFLGIFTMVHVPNELSWNEWVPADAASWQALEALMGERRSSA